MLLRQRRAVRACRWEDGPAAARSLYPGANCGAASPMTGPRRPMSCGLSATAAHTRRALWQRERRPMGRQGLANPLNSLG